MLSRIPRFTKYAARKLEYGISFYTALFGAFLLAPPTSMNSPNFTLVLNTLPEWQWAMLMLVTGVIHTYALHINGRAAWTPFARLGVLFINSQIFISIALAIARHSPFSSGVFTYGFLGIGFCGMALYAAGVDCGREVKIWRERRNAGS